MNTSKRSFIFLLTTLLVLSLACSSVAELSATATPLPTLTFTPAPPTSTPTPAGPVSTTDNPLVASVGDLKLSGLRYQHPNGLASFYPMEGWDIEETDYSVSMTHPETGVSYYISATNTGYMLEAESYENFRLIMEEIYTSQANYVEIDAGANPGIQLYFVEKTYTGYDEENYYVYSIYQQFDNVIYTIEVSGKEAFVQANPVNPYRIMFDSFTQTLEINSTIASEFPMYQQSWVYTPDDNNVSLEIPWAWSYYPDSVDETLYYTYFYSPDNLAGVEFIRQNTVKLTPELGLDFAVNYLNLLHSGEANDVKINIFGELQELETGLYLIDWQSETSGEIGNMLFDIRTPNKLIMVVSLVADEELLPIYANTLGIINDSYQLGQ
ncbi:MAG TPA: hypothetical protein PK152_00810 [Anaerolineales bacterium]|nr:hypothetical protein [Anaerolineae bacterium]HRJ56622.1 hypothetical protein [Anaerolineales bacterium]HRK87640.1 hypothetical protein [Anaerolineales bacterium]